VALADNTRNNDVNTAEGGEGVHGKEAKLGLGLALVFALLCLLVLYLAPGALPSALGGRPTSEEVVQAFQVEGLEVGTYYPVEEEREDGTPSPLPKTYVEGMRFTIPSLKEAKTPRPRETPKRRGPDGRPLPESQQPKAPEIPEIPGDVGGRVFVFDNQHDLETMRNYYENGIPHMLGSSTHLYEERLVLVQLNSDLPKDQADEYGEVLKRVA
jgi:hypothetical protein